LPSPTTAPLTLEEEVTLRRVAFGQSEVRAMRRADLVQLRRLGLIEDAKDGPRLTAQGKVRFDSLAKPFSPSKTRQYEAVMAEIRRMSKAFR
jgi:ribosomal protein S19E (S16A)